MGLDTTHDCWHGSYGNFMWWRQSLARAAGLPPLDLMEGFYDPRKNREAYDPIYWARKGLRNEEAFEDIRSCLPIRWGCLKPDILHNLLQHSDCDGSIPAAECLPLADRLESLLPELEKLDGGIGSRVAKTKQFIAGLREAAAANEDVEFR